MLSNLDIYKKTSIAVVCSRWEEPFGRTSLEASSAGCAVIISNRGGLPETITNGIILKNLTAQALYKNIKLYNLALSDCNGESELKLPLRSKSLFKDNIEELYQLGAATMHPNNYIEKYKKMPIKLCKLDDIVIDNTVGFIKIDVEGHEKNVLLGGQSLINRDKPILLIEIEERHTKIPIRETINFIKTLNYNCYYLSGNELRNIENIKPTNLENNFIFLPK